MDRNDDEHRGPPEHGGGAVVDLPEVDGLFDLAPAAFTAERNALVRALRAEGRREEAAAVGALRRPPASAWALNRIARSQPRLVEDALAAGHRLRAAVAVAMSGEPVSLQEPTADDRAASIDLIEAAMACLDSPGPAVEARAAATVRAAVLDDAVALDLRRGTLTADHDRSGLGLGAELDAPNPTGRHLRAVPDAAPAASSARTAAARRRPSAGSRGATLADRRAAERAQVAATAAAADARRAADQARLDAEVRAHRRRVNQLRTEATRAAKRAARLAQAAEDAEARAVAARAEADAADAAARSADQALAAERATAAGHDQA